MPAEKAPPVGPDAALLVRLGRWRRLAWAVLTLERLWPLILPPICVAGLFAALALFDLPSMLPGWLHGLLLLGFGGTILGLLIRAGWRLHLPDGQEAARRLERDSGLPHRPLDVLTDRPVAADSTALALWQAHCRRVAAMVGQLRVSPPQSDMAARDPWGARAAVLLLLVIAATYGHAQWPQRLDRALSPGLGRVGIGPESVEVWLTPPAYTRIAPMVLHAGEDKPLSVPAGSSVLAVLSGGWGAARMELDGSGRDFQRQDDGSQRLETKILSGNRLEIRQLGLSVARWPITVVADAVPSIAFAAEPEAGERSRLRLALTASDDYGLAKAWVEVRRMGAPPDSPALVVDLPLPSGQPRNADMAGWFDLTAHPWAGLAVTMRPVVQDALGQTGIGDAVTLSLPEREFKNPVAAAIVSARRDLTEDASALPDAITVLDRATSETTFFNDDIKAFLMLRAARHALVARTFDLDEVQGLMWNGALRIEEGDLASAERALEEARQALEQAIDSGASQAELDQLLDQFQQALERAMQAMAEQMQMSPEDLQAQGDGNVITGDELRQMVEALREMSQSGSREGLKQMLREMSQIIDSLQSGSRQPPPSAEAQQGVRELRDLVRRQQQLLDQSHGRAQQQPDGRRDSESRKATEDQKALRNALAQATRRLENGLGEAPQSLSDAGQAMDEAARQLQDGNWGAASDSQSQALEQMRQAAREALEQMGGAGTGMGGMIPRDPLGRAMGGRNTVDDGTTKVPDRSEVQRSRDLLNEIRRRSGEYQRPEPERDYLRRLLRQF